MNVRKKFSLKNRLYLLLLICVIPLTVMITYLLFMINNVSSKYDHIVEKITKANAYNIGFKEDIDYVMYIIVVNSERAEELVDTQKPQKMIKEAREVFGELAEDADSAYAKHINTGMSFSLYQRRQKILHFFIVLQIQTAEKFKSM